MRSSAPRERTGAFAPGRVNLIGEHTDYNRGLALPFAIAEGITVRAEACAAGSPASQRIYAHARDLGEHDEFALADPSPAPGWRAFVRGTVAELGRAGFPLVGARLEISGGLPRGAGLSSSAALEVALCLAMLDLGSGDPSFGQRDFGRREIARLCSRVENEWVGAQTGLLDQLASLYGEPDTALCIDFRTLRIDPVPLQLDAWRLVVLDSGERHIHASSGYNERRAECARACALLGVESLREATAEAVALLPEPLELRASHVVGENDRVRAAVDALRAGDLAAVGALLNASHASLRDRYEVSTAAVEAAVERLLRAGAAGARVVGGGFGGCVLGLFAPDVPPPADALEVRPGAGAHLLKL
jgi:galactokinase